jgi:autotransporter adhesin
MRHIPMFTAAAMATAIAACFAPSSARAQTTGTQVTDTGGYAAVCTGGTDAQGNPTPCAATTTNSYGAQATGVDSNAFGIYATASGTASVAVGEYAQASSMFSIAIGQQAKSSGMASTAVGELAAASSVFSTAIGTQATASGSSSVAGGFNAQATTTDALAMGDDAIAGSAGGTGEIALGSDSAATGPQSIALGYGAQATGAGSVAIGMDSVADENNTVSVGSSLLTRRIVNVSDGINGTDAVNVEQLTPAITAFGGGAAFKGGVFTAPTYVLTAQGAAGTYNNVGSALLALDNGLNAVNTLVDNIPAGPVGPAGPTGPQGPPGTGTSDPLAVNYDNSSKTSVTLAGAGGTQIHNLAAGSVSTDAANVGQVRAAVSTADDYTDTQVQQVRSWAQSYTDAQTAAALHEANAYTDWKFSQLGEAVSRVASEGSAAVAMSSNFRGDDSLAAGAGWAGGHSALAMGYRHVLENGHVSLSVHGEVSGFERSLGAGMGYSW